MTGTRSESYSRRVSRGARLLDARYPGWWRYVDTRRIDTSSVRDCVLGQLVRARVIRPVWPGTQWGHTLEVFGLHRGGDIAYGFDAHLTRFYARNLARIDAHWRQEINRRASAA